ncbi:MAG: hypothetical protein ABFS10_13025 [Bacteroidota bacterium]
MNGNFISILKRYAVVLVICVMGVMVANKAVYIHIHVMDNGTVITHAHPFNKSQESEQGKSHQHSNLEFFLFQSLQILFTWIAVSVALINISKKTEKRYFTRGHLTPALIPVKPGRAPPHCM